MIGFGPYRQGAEELCAALAAGDLETARTCAREWRAREEQALAQTPLGYLLTFLHALESGDGQARSRYVEAAREPQRRLVLTGTLEHDELADVLSACEALVVPSTFGQRRLQQCSR